MGRHKKANIQGLIITFNGKSTYIDFSSKNNTKMNDIINQIHLTIKPPNTQENNNPLTDSYNVNSIESNQKEEMPQNDYFTLDDNDFFNDSNSDFFDVDEEMYNYYY